jgi:hypothetical protein
MSSLPVSFDPYAPIPNTPFYTPYSPYLQGVQGPIVVGSGLSISLDGVISSTGGGGGGTVTSITAGTGLFGGNITTTGTLGIAPTGVVAGAYTFPALSINAQGQVTSIASGFPVLTVTANAPLSVSGTPQLPVLSVAAASITSVGVTQLNNTTSSTLTNQALTAAAGKNLQDQINAVAQGSGSLILAGTINCATGNVVTATTAGTTAGILPAAPVPAAAPALNDYYLVVTTAATSYTPTGGTAIANVNVGDYIICASSVWTILRVGPITGAYATTTTAGVVELATGAEAIAGINPNVVLTPSTAAGAYVPKNTITAKGQLIVGTGSGAFTALGVGVDGYVATADSSCPSGIKWAAPAGGGGSGSISITGLAPVYVTPSPLTGIGAVGIANASTTAVGAVQLADNAATAAGTSTALAVTPAAGAANYFLTCAINAKGDLIVGCANDCAIILPAGANGQALIACSTCTQGLTWGSPSVPATPQQLGSVYGRPNDVNLNSSFGCNALTSIAAGVGNTAIGYGAGALVSAGNCNAALGTGALAAETTGSSNTALGTGALCAQSGASNNTAIGFGAGNSITTGFNNTALGSCAADSLTTGSFNVLLGQGSGLGMTTGCENTFVGDASGPLNVGGCFNVYLGSSAGATNTSGSRVVIIGADGTSSSNTVSNEVSLWAGTQVARFSQASPVWSFPSDARRKENIADLTLGLDFVSKVQPRTFDWKMEGNHAAGFIAQELDEVVQEFGAEHLCIVSKADPECFTVSQTALIPVLVNAIKELKAEVEELKKKLG